MNLKINLQNEMSQSDPGNFPSQPRRFDRVNKRHITDRFIETSEPKRRDEIQQISSPYEK